MPDATELVHGTCVALGRTAALLRGPVRVRSSPTSRCVFCSWPGADPPPWKPPILVADDQVCLVRNDGRLLARPPDTIRGKMEVRGVGIVEVKSLMEAELALVVDLTPAAEIERLPEGSAKARLLGVELPLIALFPWEASAPIKLVIALARAKHS